MAWFLHMAKLVKQYEYVKCRFRNHVDSGGFGKVFKEEMIDATGAKKIVAAKLIDKEGFGASAKYEIAVASKVSHKTIVKFEAFTDDQPYKGDLRPVIVMEYYPNGSLHNMLSNPTSEWRDSLRSICAIGIAEGMRVLHENNIIHRDLKPLNVILDQNLEPKICDFGLARELDGDAQALTEGGTNNYAAPEKGRSHPSDLWGYGLILIDLYFGLNNVANIGSLSRDKYPQIIDLALQCRRYNPNERPTFKEIVRMMTQENFLPGSDSPEFKNYVASLKIPESVFQD